MPSRGNIAKQSQRILGGAILALVLFSLPTSADALCCKCYKGAREISNSFCPNGPTPITSCASLVQDAAPFTALRTSSPDLLTEVSCDPTALSDTACQEIGSGSSASAVCQSLAPLTEVGLRAAIESLTAGPAEGSATGEVEAPSQFQSLTPKLGVEIPGLNLSPATQVGNSTRIPFLAEYINGIYRYLVGIVLIVAIVMMVYGGFRYLIGSAMDDVSKGKTIIRDALIGMVLVIGAYTILNTVNPATVSLKILQVPFVKHVALDEAESGIESDLNEGDIGQPRDPAEPPPASVLAECERLRPYIEDETITFSNPVDRAGLLSGRGFIRRIGGAPWCQMTRRTEDPEQCTDLPTLADLERVTRGQSPSFDDSSEGVPIHNMLCRYLLDLAQAKNAGQIRGNITAKIIGIHSRCSNGAWFLQNPRSNENCNTLKTEREECFRCIETLLDGGTRGQSLHWTGQAFDISQNNDVQTYTVNVLAPRYKTENGGNPVIDDVFGNVIPNETRSAVNCNSGDNRNRRYATPDYCLNGTCGPGTQTSVGIICGHSGGSEHVHVSFR